MTVPSLGDLQVVEQLRVRKAQYCRFLDTKRWDEWADVFCADAVLHNYRDRRDALRGRDAIRDRVRSENVNVITVHQCHNPEISVLEPGRARAIWSLADWKLSASLGNDERVVYRGFGYYDEQYVCESDGQWRIQELKLYRLHLEVHRHFRDSFEDLACAFDAET